MSSNDFPDDASTSTPAFQPSEADLLVGAGQHASFTSKLLIGELLMFGAYIVLVLLAVYTIV
ncbi:hypothetical protein BDV98DRAFT_591160 [Pterulicium gracile]|uniref:Uncharacterized protein n=1 Tax=Pterulicium gracile TaxID=1884261 RepID=A0A5C3QRV3_9AGAR|nr:hypothetical protein BDV98DRAFT_591160 [Pterula gracilis]